MEYLNNLIKLHKSSVEILEKITVIKLNINRLEQSQTQFKKTFGKTSGEFAHQILIEHRRLKILFRSYSKILNKINH